MKKRLFLFLLPLFLANAVSTPLPKRAGKDYAVFFYVTTFQPGWQPLPDTKTEAESLKKELETNYGFECKLVPNPSRQQIYDEIAAWNNRLGPDDQVLFFFSMHGYYDPGSELGYLVAADGLYRDDYYKTWLDYNSLRPYFTKCKAKHVLVALDACYSGSFGNIEKSPDRPAYDEDQDCQAQIDATFNYRARQYVCAGSRSAKTPGKSLFAAKFLETLRQGYADADGILHFDDLTYALGKVRNPEPVHGAFSGHAPGGEFIFVRKNACDDEQRSEGSERVGDPAEEQTWKIAQKQGNGKIYLDEYPNGKYAQAAKNLEAAPINAPPIVVVPAEKPSVPRKDSHFNIDCQFTYDFELSRYVLNLRPVSTAIKDKKLKERILKGDTEYFEKQLKRPFLSDNKKDEYNFYLGYTLFITKRFSLSKGYLSSISENPTSDYYAASNYYIACSNFFESKFDESIKRFLRAKNYAPYSKYVDMPIVASYYEKAQLDQVISAGLNILNRPDSIIRNKLEISGIVGSAYFEQKNYANALPHLEYAIANGNFYDDNEMLLKLARTQMERGFFKQAIQNFESVSKKEGTKEAQQALYYLARSYLALADKPNARRSLSRIIPTLVDKGIKEEVALNFGKLSYELKFYKEAATTLSTLIHHEKYGPEAQYWLNLALNNK